MSAKSHLTKTSTLDVTCATFGHCSALPPRTLTPDTKTSNLLMRVYKQRSPPNRKTQGKRGSLLQVALQALTGGRTTKPKRLGKPNRARLQLVASYCNHGASPIRINHQLLPIGMFVFLPTAAGFGRENVLCAFRVYA